VALVRQTTKPLELTLFFPPSNDVLEQARDYIDTLASQSRLANVRVVDQALDPELARKLKVRGNGYLAITHEERTELIRLGLEVEDARGTLRQLDGKVQQALLKVLRPARVAYFTSGHLERDYASSGDDKRLAMRDFRQLLEMLGFKVKRLGLGEGLGTAVPEDASLVIIAGPLEPFLPEERSTIEKYLDRGGALLALIDPDTGALENALLAKLGLQVSKALVANDRFLVRVQDRAESPYYLATTRASAHPSVDTISQGGGRLATVLLGTGALSKLAETPGEKAAAEPKVTFTLRAMPQSWLDANGTGKLDPDEKKDALDFAAAVERPNAAGDDGNPVRDLRAIVVADADVAGDGLVANAGNGYFLSDCVRWLVNDEESAGTTETEEDLPIVHKKDEDAKWFYGTSFVFPALVLGGGLWLSRRRRGGKRGA
ncbi:MAG: Gldg family protein, partial [Acidobacteriota bacterium]